MSNLNNTTWIEEDYNIFSKDILEWYLEKYWDKLNKIIVSDTDEKYFNYHLFSKQFRKDLSDIVNINFLDTNWDFDDKKFSEIFTEFTKKYWFFYNLFPLYHFKDLLKKTYIDFIIDNTNIWSELNNIKYIWENLEFWLHVIDLKLDVFLYTNYLDENWNFNLDLLEENFNLFMKNNLDYIEYWLWFFLKKIIITIYEKYNSWEDISIIQKEISKNWNWHVLIGHNYNTLKFFYMFGDKNIKKWKHDFVWIKKEKT